MSLRELSDREVLDLVADHRLGRWYGLRDPRNYDPDPLLLRLAIGELMRRKVYPTATQPGNPNTVWGMVEGWGAEWHEWRAPLACPHCAADLRDRRVGPPFKREIGHYDRSRDMTTAYQCPDCKQTWPRTLKAVAGRIEEET